MALLLLMSVGGSLALATSGETPDGDLVLPEVNSPQDLASLVQDSQQVDIEADTDPVAAEQLPHTNLDRSEAEALLQGVFGEELEAAAEFFDELEVEAFRSDHVAVVDGPTPAASAGLISSLLPLRTEDESGQDKIIDLDLENTGGRLEPENPLVEVEIPTQLSDGISLPQSGVTIEVATGETDRGASEVGEATAFFPNVRPQTDIAVTALPTGVETYTQLRSAEAPRNEVFDLNLPGGTQLRTTAAGGAEVIDPSDDVLLAVSSPWAIDAEGEQVPARLEVEGHSVIVSVDPPADAAYPILVDPLFEYYNFNYLTDGGIAGADWTQMSNPGFGALWGWPNYGMTAHSSTGATSPGNQGVWNYTIPRFWSDYQAVNEHPKSYIRAMSLWHLTFMMPEELGIPAGSRPAYPFMQLGLWDNFHQQFAAFHARFGYQGQWTDGSYVFNMYNPNENTDVKQGGFALATWDSWNSALRYVNVQQAVVEITDQDSPAFGEMATPSQWLNSQPDPAIKYEAGDEGLGIHHLRFAYPAASGGTKEISTLVGCLGTAGSACPRTTNNAAKPLAYDPQLMTQGEHYVTIKASDPVGHVAISNPRVKVDHTPPAVALSGNLTEQATAGTKLTEYTLSYKAEDGDEAAAAALAPIASSGTGPGQMQAPIGVEIDSAGSLWAVDRLNRRVQKFSPAGSLLAEFPLGSIAEGPVADPRDLAITPAGEVWISDAATKRIIKYSPTGQVLAKFGESSFVEPFGLAEGAEGTIWVTDVGSQSVYKFRSSDGALLKRIKTASGVQLAVPLGIDSDAFGGIWVTERASNRVVRLEPDGASAFAFGGPGSGDGQLLEPTGLTVAPSGNVFVVDSGNNRVQVFEPDGTFLRKFGASVAGNGQLSGGARGIAVASDRTAFIADMANQRIARWEHADKDPQSGAAKVQIKVDGTGVMTKEPGCATKNCSLSGSWVLDADDFSPGLHKVEVTATDGVGLTATKTLDVETHGDRTNPSIELSGTMTEQASLGGTRPSYKLKAVATDPGPAEERKSGVASTTIKVDGNVVDASAPGCPVGGCSITREWTLNSDSYAPGFHIVEVKATDTAGRSNTKSLFINIARDITAPKFATLDSFYTAPSGWVEQKLYPYEALATDVNGYGVTSVQLKIDGKVVQSLSQTCPAGGCFRHFAIGQKLDMESYAGGEHPAELIATDGAGNTRKRSWTIKVDPDGQISISEAEDTLEAVDGTSPVNTLGAPQEEDGYEGTAPGLAMEEVDDTYVSTGGANSAEIATTAGSDMVVNVASPGAYQGECESEAPSEPQGEPTSESEVPADGSALCTPQEASVDFTSQAITSVEVTPTAVAPAATSTELSDKEVAGVSSNVAPHVDFVTRPLFDGTMTFAAIRDAAGPETFSWKVNLAEDQELKPLDSTHLGVYYKDGPQVFSISAVPAHDAVGTTVPTTLTTDGNDIMTLTVGHRELGPEGKPFVYPVVGGTGWEGGFQTYLIVGPPNTEQEEPPESAEEGYASVDEAIILIGQGPPIPRPGDPTAAALKSAGQPIEKKFKFVYCKPHEFPGGAGIAPYLPELIPIWVNGKNLPMIVSECNNPALEGIFWKASAHGWFHYIRGEWVWLKSSQWDCEKGGEEKDQFGKIRCIAHYHKEDKRAIGSAWASRSPIKLMGNYRFPPNTGDWDLSVYAVCFTEGGVLTSTPNKVLGRPTQRPMIWEKKAVHYTESCDWPGY